MADIRIKDAADIGVLDGTESIPVDKDGSTIAQRTVMSAVLDYVKANIKAFLFGSAPNYSEFMADGSLRMFGTATVFDDALSSMIGLKLESPASDIFLNLAECTVTFKKTCTLADYVIAPTQLSHAWAKTVLKPHLHWEQASATMPNLLIQYRWRTAGKAKVTGWTSLARTSDVFTYTTGTMDQISVFGSITPPVGYGMSDIIQFRILRDSTNASGLFAGADPLNASVETHFFDCHIEKDRIGSHTEYAP